MTQLELFDRPAPMPAVLPQTLVGNIEEYVRADREQRDRVKIARIPHSKNPTAYLHPGAVELWVFKDASFDALLKLQTFVDGLVDAATEVELESRPCA